MELLLEGQKQGKFSLTARCIEQWESLVHIRGVTVGAQLTCGLLSSKGFLGTAGPGKGAQEGSGQIRGRNDLLASLLRLAAAGSALASVTMHCKTFLKANLEAGTGSRVLDVMVVEKATGTESRGAGKDPVAAEILLQKHKPEIV